MKSVISMELKFNIPPSSICRLLKTICDILRGGGQHCSWLSILLSLIQSLNNIVDNIKQSSSPNTDASY